ncbi:UNVERIFIED_CONTAM: hypothetical protein Sradi_3244600 [Sesamum radiatum]|uniref:Uncharacterized protein n=1 Tax=Sesamum radiatum TaxID=300843 RepID=A0AAW2R0B8_SESRA
MEGGCWMLTRKSRARQVFGCWLAGRELVRSLDAGSPVVSCPGRWLLGRQSRARQVAGCWVASRELARLLAASLLGLQPAIYASCRQPLPIY